MRLTLMRGQHVEVATLADASRAFRAFIMANGYGFSAMHRESGRVREGRKTVARISYNGRAWTTRDEEIPL